MPGLPEDVQVVCPLGREDLCARQAMRRARRERYASDCMTRATVVSGGTLAGQTVSVAQRRDKEGHQKSVCIQLLGSASVLTFRAVTFKVNDSKGPVTKVFADY